MFLTKPLILTSVVTALMIALATPAAIGMSTNDDTPVLRKIVALSAHGHQFATTSSSDAEAQPDGDRATGGGQILFASRGAGNTIAFNAHGDATDGKGQLQFIDRSGGNGQDQVRQHGEVTCIEAEGNTAKIAGVLRDGSAFNLVVVDNGEGAAANQDMIFYESMAESPECDFDDPDQDDFVALARGNVQVYDSG